jgi:ribosomal protein L7/L12
MIVDVFDMAIYLNEISPNRLKVLAYLRDLLKLSLEDVARIPKSLPFKVAQGVPHNGLSAVKTRLESLGCTIEFGECTYPASR